MKAGRRDSGPSLLLLRSSAELVDRISRLKRHLDASGTATTEEHAQIVKTIRTPLDQILQLLAPTLARTFARKNADKQRLDVLHNHLARLSRWFTTIHELSVYLPTPPVARETMAVLHGAFGDHYKEQSPSPLVGTIFNAFEFDFLQVVEQRLPDLRNIVTSAERNVVLQLAVCDRESPAAWAVLAHEMGHAIDDHATVSQQAVSVFVKDQTSPAFELLLNWCQEMCADIIAAEALGPASLLALLSIEYCILPCYPIHGPTTTHPPTRWRFRIVADHLKVKYAAQDYLRDEAALYEDAWRYSATRAGLNPSTAASRDAALFRDVISPLTAEVRGRIKALSLPPHTITQGSLRRCMLRLERGFPISAQGADRGQLRGAVRDYRRARIPIGKARVRAFRRLKERFLERPVSFPQILLSAHKRRLALISEFSANCRSDPSAAIDTLEKRLAHLDELILGSIRMSSVHHRVGEERSADG